MENLRVSVHTGKNICILCNLLLAGIETSLFALVVLFWGGSLLAGNAV